MLEMHKELFLYMIVTRSDSATRPSLVILFKGGSPALSKIKFQVCCAARGCNADTLHTRMAKHCTCTPYKQKATKPFHRNWPRHRQEQA